jgi:hypothetical protein
VSPNGNDGVQSPVPPDGAKAQNGEENAYALLATDPGDGVMGPGDGAAKSGGEATEQSGVATGPGAVATEPSGEAMDPYEARNDVEAKGSCGAENDSAAATPVDGAMVPSGGATNHGDGRKGPILDGEGRCPVFEVKSGDEATGGGATGGEATDLGGDGGSPSAGRSAAAMNADVGSWAIETPSDGANGSLDHHGDHQGFQQRRHGRGRHPSDGPCPLHHPTKRSWRKMTTRRHKVSCVGTQARRQSVAGVAATQQVAQKHDEP